MIRKCLGQEGEIETNKKGGKQCRLDFAFHLMDAPAMLALAEVLEKGARKYARDNWRLIDEESHINHALTHLFAYQAGNKQDDHLEHALCRVMMALAKKIRPQYLGYAKKGKK